MAETARALTRNELENMLAGADRARICLIGDLCLDMYWLADMKLSELSRETPHYPLPVVEERFSPGGAGNAACNIAELRPGKFSVVGLVGMDWRGDLLMKALSDRGICTEHIVRSGNCVTNTYIKPLRRGISEVVYEDPRLDFENRAPMTEECENMILAALEKAAEDAEVICVSDQMKFGCITPRVRERLSRMGREGKTVIVDSRDHIGDYENVIVKPNEIEAARAYGDGKSLEEIARRASIENGRPFIMTLGEKGCYAAEDGRVTHCPACPVEGPIDFCGAGDTFLSGFGVMLAAGSGIVKAAQAANLCSAVTIKKIGTTGTAGRDEVLAAWDRYFSGEEK